MLPTSHVHVLVADSDKAVEQELVRILSEQIDDCHAFAFGAATQLPCAIDKLGELLREQAALNRCHIIVVDRDLLGGQPTEESWCELRAAVKPAHCVLHMGDQIQTLEAMYAISAGMLVSPIHRANVSHQPLGLLTERFVWHLRARKLTIRPATLIKEIVAALNDINQTQIDDADIRDLMEHLFPNASVISVGILPAQKQSALVPCGHSILLQVTETRLANGKWRGLLPVVLKIAPRHKIEKEARRYDTYVKGHLKGMRHTYLERCELRWHIGGIIYSLLGTSDGPLKTFAAVYSGYIDSQVQADTRQALKHITGILTEVFSDTWSKHYLDAELADPSKSIVDQYADVWTIDWKKRLQPFVQRETGSGLLNPAAWVLENLEDDITSDLRRAITHGDMHPDNILVDHLYSSWLIDFERSGYGPVLQDFAQLEFNLITRLDLLPSLSDYDGLIYDLYIALTAPKTPVETFSEPDSFQALPQENAFRKALEPLEFIRGLAHSITRYTDIREYLWGVLLNALYIITRDLPAEDLEVELQRRSRAWLLASVICGRLAHWRILDEPSSTWPPQGWPMVSFNGEASNMSDTMFPRPIKILALSANPLDTTPLLIDEEFSAIDAALQKGEFRNRFELEQHGAVRYDRLHEYLERYKPGTTTLNRGAIIKSRIRTLCLANRPNFAYFPLEIAVVRNYVN